MAAPRPFGTTCRAAAKGKEVLSGVVFLPLEELKGELSLVPQKPDQSLTRHKYIDECEAAINQQIKSVFCSLTIMLLPLFWNGCADSISHYLRRIYGYSIICLHWYGGFQPADQVSVLLPYHYASTTLLEWLCGFSLSLLAVNLWVTYNLLALVRWFTFYYCSVRMPAKILSNFPQVYFGMDATCPGKSSPRPLLAVNHSRHISNSIASFCNFIIAVWNSMPLSLTTPFSLTLMVTILPSRDLPSK
jgi:hypothetical protein